MIRRTSRTKVSILGISAACALFSCGRSEKISVSTFDFQSSTEGPAVSAPPLSDSQDAEALIERVIAATSSTLLSEITSSSVSVFRVPPTPTPTPEPLSSLKQQDAVSSSSPDNARLSLTTPQTMLLTATNLEQVLRPVFGISGQLAPADTRYFLPSEKRNLGEYMMLEVTNLETIRMGLPVRLTQDYIFTMRTFAGRACNSLVNSENSNPTSALNRLVRKADLDSPSRSVSLTTVNSFMTQVFGYEPVSPAGHAGAQEFVSLFAESVTNAVNVERRTLQSALLENYKLLCVYVVTDPRTFSR